MGMISVTAQIEPSWMSFSCMPWTAALTSQTPERPTVIYHYANTLRCLIKSAMWWCGNASSGGCYSTMTTTVYWLIFSLVTCHVCVAPACLCKCAWVRVSVSAQVLGGGRGRNERWWRCEERAAAASFTAHLIPLQSQCLSFSFQEKCGVCGRVGSAINAGCQRENAGVYTMPLNHWVKVFLLHSPPPRTFFLFIFFPRRKQQAVSQGCIQWKIWARGWTFLVQ